MNVHPQASAFDHVAGEYERGRPGYPLDVLDWLGNLRRLTPADTVVDLGAGTGKFTRLLVSTKARVIAVEPLTAMREILQSALPEVESIEGTAEAIPLPNAAADVLTVAQALHWFATPVALAEIARVLHPSGLLVVVQNRADESDPVQRRIAEIRREAESEAEESSPGQDWKQIVVSDPHFSLIGEVTLRGKHLVDREGVVSRVRSSSPVARLPEARQREMIRSVEALLHGEMVDLTPLTDVVAFRKVVG